MIKEEEYKEMVLKHKRELISTFIEPLLPIKEDIEIKYSRDGIYYQMRHIHKNENNEIVCDEIWDDFDESDVPLTDYSYDFIEQIIYYLTQDKYYVIKRIILKMTDKELIEEINSNIDDHLFTLSKIEDIDNVEYWDALAKYIGGYKLAKLVSEANKVDNPKWVIYDSEVSAIAYFATKEDIIEYFGIENIIDNYINEQ